MRSAGGNRDRNHKQCCVDIGDRWCLVGVFLSSHGTKHPRRTHLDHPVTNTCDDKMKYNERTPKREKKKQMDSLVVRHE
jgi:hypothetical protein